MRRTIRTYLSCLIMVAIPLHGFAASSMILCGPHHDALAQRAAAAHDHGDSHAHHPHDVASPNEGDDTQLDDFLKSLGVKCSACAACCALSAMPVTAMPALTFVPSISVAVPFFGSSYAGIVPDGLERPPSQHLA